MSRGNAALMVEADDRRAVLTRDAAQGSVLGERADLAQQHRVTGKAEDVADALALAPRHRLGPGVMAVAAHQDIDRRPAGMDMADDMAQYQGYLGTVRCLARAQDDRHRLAGQALGDPQPLLDCRQQQYPGEVIRPPSKV